MGDAVALGRAAGVEQPLGERTRVRVDGLACAITRRRRKGTMVVAGVMVTSSPSASASASRASYTGRSAALGPLNSVSTSAPGS